MAIIIFKRLVIMFIYMLTGFILYKKKLITNEGTRDMGKILINVILPASIISSYNIDFSKEMAIGLLISFAAAVITLLASIYISKLFFGKKRPIEWFGVSFSNAAFMGLPLAQAAMGAEAVYYASAYAAILNLLQWTFGVYIITGNKEAVSPKKVLWNPILISFLMGVVLFFMPFKIPTFFADIMTTVANMNAPFAMIIIGAYLAQVTFKKLVSDPICYKAAAVRLVLIPIVVTAILALLPFGSTGLKQSILILAAAPVGSNVAVCAQLYGGDYKQAVKNVVLCTLLCILTMPVIIGLSDWIFTSFKLF